MEASLAHPTLDEELINDEMSAWATRTYLDKYSWKDEDGNPTEVWPDTAYRVVRNVLGALGYTDRDYEFQRMVEFISQRKFMPGGRYLYGAGKQFHAINNCFLYRCGDSREGWAELSYKSIMSLTSGGGVGVVYSDVRHNGSLIKSTGGIATGPLSPAQMINEIARHVEAGGSRRAALWGGLHWWHKDIFDWITIKDWSQTVKDSKDPDKGGSYNNPAPLDMTNISVILDSAFFTAYNNEKHPQHEHAHKVYWMALEHMLENGEPGFSIDTGQNVHENLRNPCCEVTSEDDSDVCCLGSINLARIESLDELREITSLGTLFLLAGTVYSDIPHEEVRRTREKNRRIGLGFMGVHEWLIQRGADYEVTPELHSWLSVYEGVSDTMAVKWADKHHLSHPIKKRAVAPTGTIGILAETTTGIEPVFAAAYIRKFVVGKTQKYQYVIDPTVERMRNEYGIDPDKIDTAWNLSYTPEKRVKFQADIQRYVDMGISSTINLPAPITDPDWVKDYGDTFMKHLPNLRGLTVYPNGARSGQPLEPVSYAEAKDKVGVTYDDNRDEQCLSGSCGV
jgi:ribonucleoside-diphosphate reductase alpha chain